MSWQCTCTARRYSLQPQRRDMAMPLQVDRICRYDNKPTSTLTVTMTLPLSAEELGEALGEALNTLLDPCLETH